MYIENINGPEDVKKLLLKFKIKQNFVNALQFDLNCNKIGMNEMEMISNG